MVIRVFSLITMVNSDFENLSGFSRKEVEGRKVIIINRDQTPYDDTAACCIREPLAEVLPRIMQL